MVTIPFADELAIRAWVGHYVPDDHNPLYEELGDGLLVALHVLRERLSELALEGAAKAGVDGDYSEDWSRNLTILENQIARLESLVDNLDLGADTSMKTLTPHRVQRGGVRVRRSIL